MAECLKCGDSETVDIRLCEACLASRDAAKDAEIARLKKVAVRALTICQPSFLSRIPSEEEACQYVRGLEARIADALALATKSQPPEMFLKFEAILAPEKGSPKPDKVVMVDIDATGEGPPCCFCHDMKFCGDESEGCSIRYSAPPDCQLRHGRVIVQAKAEPTKNGSEA